MPENILQPGYAATFKCISSDCEDTCCRGWQVTVDKDTFDRYKHFPDEDIRQRLKRHIIAQADAGQEDYAGIKMPGPACPFLTPDRLCRIQEIGGEGYLSLTCANYPRNYNLVNGRLELSMDLSCPEAARLALLGSSKMQFVEAGIASATRIGDCPVVDSADPLLCGGIHGCFDEIRSFVLSLVQNRSHCLEDRLVMLGAFCVELDGLPPGTDREQIKALIARHEKLEAGGGFSELLGSIPDEPAALLKTLVPLLEYRIKIEAVSSRFSQCFEEFKLGLHYTNYISEKDLSRNYSEAKSQAYDGFMRVHGTMLEHYFVNYIFKTLFPLGPQKCAYQKRMYMVSKSIFSTYMLLVFHFAMLKNLLTGMAGYYGAEFSADQALILMQSFARNIEHNLPYQQRILQFFSDNGMMNLACAAMLIKN